MAVPHHYEEVALAPETSASKGQPAASAAAPPTPPCAAAAALHIHPATLEQLAASGRLQQLQDIDARVFGSRASRTTSQAAPSTSYSDLQQELQHSTARVLWACEGAEQAAAGDHLAAAPLGYVLYRTNSLTVHILRVAVLSEARRRGVGRALVEVGSWDRRFG
jgi:hypothetical protein